MSITDVANGQPWVELARCREIGPADHVWFPDRWKRPTDARRICGGCEVATHCLEYAITTGQSYGIWAGTTPEQRIGLRRSRKRGRPRHREGCPCAVCVTAGVL